MMEEVFNRRCERLPNSVMRTPGKKTYSSIKFLDKHRPFDRKYKQTVGKDNLKNNSREQGGE